MNTPRCAGCTKCYAAGVLTPYEDVILCPRCMKHPKRAYTEYLRRLYGRKDGHGNQKTT